MQQRFVCTVPDLLPRWREAFPHAECVTPARATERSGADLQAWVVIEPGQDWPSLVGALAGRGVVVSVLSHSPDAAEAGRALAAGARGYAHALSPPELLRQVALVTANQGIWVWPELMARVVGGVYQALGGEASLDDDLLAPLTDRERAVARAVVEGNPNKAVARQLGITERTVKAHLGAVFRKLGVRDRMQLMRKLSRHPE
ncbi:helix-turn-helix domain-containing protein [Halomonas koreensis]|uniref:Response regulator transcription factor n=1 Tax=Halomonas koreensis TaxID=245385 RepID=A0ABU1FZA8_9GAMM|nr:response regulator transcription factor [Halomonas koreensis]MDR5866005.1 response regulator transcription factor [Halomonas koreensis]